MNLSHVNAEIKNLSNEVEHVNTRMFINMPLNEWVKLPTDIVWNVNEWLAFKNKTGACVDILGSSITSAWVLPWAPV